MARDFNIEPGIRHATPLFIGLIGPSSSGKTRSALRLASGIQSVVGGDIVFINTEGRRGTADLGLFKQKGGDPSIRLMTFDAPYASLDYLEAILTARKSGAKTIVIDSLSHEHEQEGGMLDFQEKELTRMAGDDWRKRDAMQMLAWSKPKAARRQLLTRGIMQIDVNVIACFRAKETSKPIKEDGKTKVVSLGFTPIAGDEFVYEMALSALLPPGSKGVPNWHPELPGERLAVKRPDHLEKIVPDGAQLNEDIGAALAKWAQGDAPQTPKSVPAAANRAATDAASSASGAGTATGGGSNGSGGTTATTSDDTPAVKDDPKAVEFLCDQLSLQPTLDGLVKEWKRIAADVIALSSEGRAKVTKAKDDRKAELTAAPEGVA